MNREKLQHVLERNNINPQYYSLYGELESDSIVIYKNHQRWEVFYFDERGVRRDEYEYSNENDACQAVLNKFGISI